MSNPKSVPALQMETETSLPDPTSNAGAPATASATAPAAAPAAVPSEQQPLAPQAAAEQPATSHQAAAAPQAEAAAPTQQAEPFTVQGEQAAAASVNPAQQQQANNAADPSANAMQDDSSPFTSGTVLRFDMDADDVSDSTSLDFRAIRPVFGGKEGGVRHCDYQRVSDDTCPTCKHSLASHNERNLEKLCK